MHARSRLYDFTLELLQPILQFHFEARALLLPGAVPGRLPDEDDGIALCAGILSQCTPVARKRRHEDSSSEDADVADDKERAEQDACR